MNLHSTFDRTVSRVQADLADLSSTVEDGQAEHLGDTSSFEMPSASYFSFNYLQTPVTDGASMAQFSPPPIYDDEPSSSINVPLVVGLVSGISTLFFGVLCGILWFALLGRGRIRLGPGAPGEYDDEQAALEQEVAELGSMDIASRQLYLRTRAFLASNQPNSAQTDISLAQYLSIQEKGVSAWEFEVDFPNANCFVEARTDIEFYDSSTCCTQTNLPIPKQNDVYYFEAKMFEMPSTTLVSVGLTTKPYPTFRLPGFHRFSVAYDSNGERRSHLSLTSSFGPRFQQGDVVGVGYRSRTGTIFFTHNGRRVDDTIQGFRHNMFPTIGANGPCKVSVNFGQAGFVYIEANVKKWGLAPAQGTLSPPPPYGAERDSVLLETGLYMPTTSSRNASDDVSSYHSTLQYSSSVGSSNNTLTNQTPALPPLPPPAAQQPSPFNVSPPPFSSAADDRHSTVSNYSLARLRSSGSVVTVGDVSSNSHCASTNGSFDGNNTSSSIHDESTPAPEYVETPEHEGSNTQHERLAQPGSPPPRYTSDNESEVDAEETHLLSAPRPRHSDSQFQRTNVATIIDTRNMENGEEMNLMEDYVSRCGRGESPGFEDATNADNTHDEEESSEATHTQQVEEVPIAERELPATPTEDEVKSSNAIKTTKASTASDSTEPDAEPSSSDSPSTSAEIFTKDSQAQVDEELPTPPSSETVDAPAPAEEDESTQTSNVDEVEIETETASRPNSSSSSSAAKSKPKNKGKKKQGKKPKRR